MIALFLSIFAASSAPPREYYQGERYQGEKKSRPVAIENLLRDKQKHETDYENDHSVHFHLP